MQFTILRLLGITSAIACGLGMAQTLGPCGLPLAIWAAFMVVELEQVARGDVVLDSHRIQGLGIAAALGVGFALFWYVARA